MARKDVDLVIRAKDQAASVVDTITKALNDFVSAQTDVQSGSKKTQSSLGALGASMQELKKAVGTLDIGDRLANDLDKAAGALARIEKEAADTQQEISQLSREMQRQEAVASRYQTKIAGATAALAKQRDQVAKTRAEQVQLTRASEQAAAAQAKAAARQAALPAIIERQSVAVNKAAQRYAELAAEMEGVSEPGKSLQRSMDAATKSLDKQRETLNRLQTEYTEVVGQSRAAGAAAAIFGGQARTAAENLSRQERALAKIGQNYADLSVRSRSVVDQQKQLDKALGSVQQAFARQSGQLQRAEKDYVDLAQAAGRADDVLEQLSKQSIGSLKTELDLQRRAMLEAKREYLGLSQASTQLAGTIGRAGVPTREMAAAFAQTKVEAAAAKAVYLQQRQTLELLGRAFRETGADINSLQATQARFNALQTQSRAAIGQVTAGLEQQRASINRTFGEYARAASNAERNANATRRVAEDSRRAAGSVSALAQAYRQLYGDSRQALSITQRLRGEVLALVSSYAGLFGVITLLQQTVAAYQTLEAAQARLNVANEGNIQQSANDLDFLRRTADRLGVDLGTLANEFSKFALATQGTNLQGEKTRKIFLSVAEAARVNKTSNEQLSGVFVALTQIVSKGAVQMEELRQQLGDRLPGALQIMADGLGVTTAELIKMLEAGEVTSDALVPFAEELDRRFSGALPEALKSVTTELGRLRNAAFQALLQFGQQGFIESFTGLVRNLTEFLQSADFETFSARASAAFGVIIDGLSLLVQNFDLVIAAAGAFAGLKLAPILIALGAAFGRAAFGATALRAVIAATPSGFTLVGTAAQGAASRLGIFAAAARTALSATGVGLLITGATALFAFMSAQADIATEALNTHRGLVDEVKNAYDLLGGSVENWRKGIENVSVETAKRNLESLQKALKSAERAFAQANFNDGQTLFQNSLGLGSITGASREFNKAIDDVFKRFQAGEIDARGLRDEVDAISQKFRDGSEANKRYAADLDDATARMVELQAAVEEAESVVDAVAGTTDEAEAAIRDLNNAAEDSSEAFGVKAAGAVDDFNTALETLREALPDMNKDMSEFEKTVAGIDIAFAAALKSARSMPDAIMRIAAEQAALALANQGMIDAATQFADTNFGSFTSGTEAAAALLREREGFISEPKFDVNALRVGFGSDTITLSDGTIKKVTEGMVVSVADANRDLIRRIETEFGPKAAAAAGPRFAQFTPQQQAALISIAYNYGSIPERIADEVRTGTASEVAEAIRGLAGDNGGVNRGRRLQEAALFESTAGVETLAAEQVRQDEEARRAQDREDERLAKEREATAERLANGEFELSQQELLNQGKERQAAIEEAIRSAKAENPNITQAELDAITEQTGKLFDLEQQQKNVTTAKERAEEADKRVNDLLTQRKALEEQLEFAKEDGDTAKQEELRLKMEEVNTQLKEAITNAQAMWQAVGGAESAAAIEQLNVAALQAERLGQGGQRTYLEWDKVSDMIVNGAANAFDQFARSVAEGEDALTAAKNAFLQFAADFLLQIAQMIIRQAVFNALQGAFGGTPFGSLIGLAHSGGIIGSKRAGSGNGSRRVSPLAFAGAPRYHEGGIIGMRPGEVPIIAKKGEEMLTEDDPFHSKNRGKLGLGGGPVEVKNRIINAIDGPSFLAAALASEEGEKVMMNWLRANGDAVSAAAG